MSQIRKILHFVWIGDEDLRPDNCIETWRSKNPDYKIKIWGNEELSMTDWTNSSHIQDMYDHELSGAVDMMRYEILYRHGGITLDADSVCLRPLEDWLLEPREFACWENEIVRPGLIAAGCLGAIPGSRFFKKIIEDINAEKTVTNDWAYKTVGPVRITELWRSLGYPLTIYPSHYFYPTHLTGQKYVGVGQKFAEQFWASTLKLYNGLHEFDFDTSGLTEDRGVNRNSSCPCGSGKKFKLCHGKHVR